MTAPNLDAALHLALGALKPGEIPPGHHDLSRVQLVLDFPDFASVDRAVGTAGDGWDALPPPEPAEPEKLTIPEAALWLMLERSGIRGGAKVQARWADCIRDAIAGAAAAMPASAAAALAIVQAEQPPPPVAPPAEPCKRRTSAKRTGEKDVSIKIMRRPKTAPVTK